MTVVLIKEKLTLIMDRKKVKVCFCGLMVLHMKASGRMTKLKVWADSSILMAICMKENSRKIKPTAMGTTLSGLKKGEI